MASVTISVVKGVLEGKSFTFEKEGDLRVGRSSECQCCITGDPLVSRRHAVFAVSPPRVTILDEGSTNGVEVNKKVYSKSAGNPLDKPLALAAGDSVRIGGCVFSIAVAAGADDDDATMVPTGSVPRMSSVGMSSRFSAVDANLLRESVRIEGYDIGHLLGQGGMGAVFKALMKSTGKAVAVKVMLPGVGLNKKMVDSFHREIEVTKTILHPNIVECYGDGTVDNQLLYLVLEYVNGGSLVEDLENCPSGRVPVAEALPLMLQMADGIGYAHSQNFVHRDIKPQNILLNVDGRKATVKIADMGLAKNFERAGLSGLTASFTAGGTMAYMPPEQLTEFRDVKPSADVFSLAATFYEMLTGELAYNFKRGKDKLRVIANGDIVPIGDRGADVPPRLAEVIGKCLKLGPDDRYANGHELLAALKEAAPG